MVFVVIFWGLSWPVGKIVSLDFQASSFSAAFIRFSIALPLLFLLTKTIDGSISLDRIYHRRVILLGFMQISLYNYLYLSGLRFTSSSDASLIIATNPTLTAIFASLVYADERLHHRKILGLLIAFTGVLLIFWFSPNTDQSIAPNRLLGNMIIFGGAMVWALYTTFSRPLYQKISPIKFQLWASFYGWIFLGILALTESPWTLRPSRTALWSLAYLGIFAAAIANTLFSQGVKIIGPTRTAVFVNFVPLLGVLFSIVLVGDSFGVVYLIAFVLIFTGVRLVNKRPTSDDTKPYSED